MLIGGIVSIILGSLLTLAGIGANRDVREFIKNGPNSGDGYITFGIILIAVGIVLLVMRYSKKMKNSPKK